jgi:hypothetical protein
MSQCNPDPHQPSLISADERLPRARLTLHEADPITGHEDTLSSLFYEFYRGYTIYSTPRGRCCIHGAQGCLKLQGRFVCFYDVEEAKTFIKHLRRAGYRAVDRVERYLPPEAYVWLNCWKLPRQRWAARPLQPVS